MRDEILTDRYANAIFKLAKRENLLSIFKNEFVDFSGSIISNKFLFLFLNDEEISAHKKIDLIKKIGTTANLNLLVINSINLLVSKNRIKFLKEIKNKFVNLLDDNDNIQKGILAAADKVSADKAKPIIENKLTNKLEKKIELTTKENKELIGGIKIKIKNEIWDLSYLNKLEEMKERLCQ